MKECCETCWKEPTVDYKNIEGTTYIAPQDTINPKCIDLYGSLCPYHPGRKDGKWEPKESINPVVTYSEKPGSIISCHKNCIGCVNVNSFVKIVDCIDGNGLLCKFHKTWRKKGGNAYVSRSI